MVHVLRATAELFAQVPSGHIKLTTIKERCDMCMPNKWNLVMIKAVYRQETMSANLATDSFDGTYLSFLTDCTHQSTQNST